MRKVGMAHLAKAKGFDREQNLLQTLRYGELAATKLKQLKDRRLETVGAISDALGCKFNALTFMDRQREALECIKECYTLWAMNYLRNPGSMRAALALIQSCLHNNEYEDAERYARHAYFMIAEMTDNFIPVDEQLLFLAQGSYYLATAICKLAGVGGIPPEEKQKAGEEAIGLARKALEIYTKLYGAESAKVAMAMSSLADILDHFNDVDDDEVLHLYEQSIAITWRVEGSSSPNVAAVENKLGDAYIGKASRAEDANDLDRCMVNLELALSHFREAARVYRANNHVARVDRSLRKAALVEEQIRLAGIARATAAAAATTRS